MRGAHLSRGGTWRRDVGLHLLLRTREKATAWGYYTLRGGLTSAFMSLPSAQARVLWLGLQMGRMGRRVRV